MRLLCKITVTLNKFVGARCTTCTKCAVSSLQHSTITPFPRSQLHYSVRSNFLHRLMNTENNLLQTREEEGKSFERTLVASEFIDWLLQEGEMPTREEAEQLGRRLLEHGIIQHGEDGVKGRALFPPVSYLVNQYNHLSPCWIGSQQRVYQFTILVS